VRSTTQRPGRTTKPFTSSLRFTISMRSTGSLPREVQPARHCSRHRPRSIRARGSAAVSGLADQGCRRRACSLSYVTGQLVDNALSLP
jgi:hypothetical protein